MTRYTLLQHDQRGTYEAIAQGWSWSAFLIGHLWALYHRLWGFFLGLSLASWTSGKLMTLLSRYWYPTQYAATPEDEIAQMITAIQLDLTISTLALIPVLLLAGAFGNRMLLRKRIQQGYHVLETNILAANRHAALLKAIRTEDITAQRPLQLHH